MHIFGPNKRQYSLGTVPEGRGKVVPIPSEYAHPAEEKIARRRPDDLGGRARRRQAAGHFRADGDDSPLRLPARQ